jgi:hypothetical protein
MNSRQPLARWQMSPMGQQLFWLRFFFVNFSSHGEKTSCMVTHSNTIPIKVDLTSNFLRNLFLIHHFFLKIYKVKNHF